MPKKQLFRVAMAFWIGLASACGPLQPAAISTSQPNTPMTMSAITPTLTPMNMPAMALTITPTPVPGCKGMPIDLEQFGGGAFQNPEVNASAGGVLEATLEVKYGENQIIAGCPVHLRSYNGKLVGPTLRAKPGDKIIIHLKNMLPPNPPRDPQNMNMPHDFNTTNLHTHGLHVSPSGISDNVLRQMPPPADGSKEADYEVEIDIPANHPAGTFWYHPHVHGSTSMQVSSGMEGALIIEGGLDDVPEIAAAQEKIFVFQQISYDTQGQIENFDDSLGFKNGSSQWVNLNRQHTINGQLYPTLMMRPGELQRWRFIHAGVEETIMTTLYGPCPDNLVNFNEIENCKPTKQPLNEIAIDGLALGKLDTWSQVKLQPGYRSDVLVKLEKAGTYYLIDDATPADQSLQGVPEPGKFLARVQVAGDLLQPEMPLPDASELAPLKPFEDITEKEITGTQPAVFCMCKTATPGIFSFTVNGKSFDPTNQPRQLKLNAVEKWEVSVDPNSLAPVHPFHIHVNPFQSTRTGPDGQPENVWRDTLLITSKDPKNPQTLFTRYLDFTGKFVMHCHILGHEDQGMMEMEEVVP